jgi:surface polysaccharide O-acyltransferase-like enzyme
MSNSLKLAWANNLRAAATLGVVFIHCSSYVILDFGHIDNNHWLIAVIFNTAVRWSVPVFVMLTGSFVLSNYNDQLGNFLANAFKKIIIPFLIWSIVYLLYNNWDELFGLALSNVQKRALLVEKALSGTEVHLWYVYMIISVYLVIPIFSKWTNLARTKELTLFLGCWFFFLITTPFLNNYATDFQLNYFTGYIGYLIAGFYFFKYLTLNKATLWALLIISIASIATITYGASFEKKEFNDALLSPLTPGIFIMSASIYLLFKQSSVTLSSWMTSLVNQICKYSYGIYLVHYLILAMINEYLIGIDSFHPLLSIPLISLLCFACSFGTIYLLKKLPVLGNWIG